MPDQDVRFVNSQVEVLAQTNLRDAEHDLEWRVEGELALNRFLDKLRETDRAVDDPR